MMAEYGLISQCPKNHVKSVKSVKSQNIGSLNDIK